MLWNKVLNNWESGNYPKFSMNIDKPFIWRTSPINKDENTIYKEEIKIDKRLFNKKQDYSLYLKPPASLLKKKNEYVISSKNLSKDTILVIPKPKDNKNFANLYFFMKNASENQKRKVWQKVARESRKLLQKNDYIWISTHGLAIDYLHIRISTKPKYYEKSKLQYITNKVGGSKKKNTKKYIDIKMIDKWCKTYKNPGCDCNIGFYKGKKKGACLCDCGDGEFPAHKDLKKKFGNNIINSKDRISI